MAYSAALYVPKMGPPRKALQLDALVRAAPNCTRWFCPNSGRWRGSSSCSSSKAGRPVEEEDENEDEDERYGSWKAPTISKSRIEARNRRPQTFVAYATKVCTGGDDGSWKEWRSNGM